MLLERRWRALLCELLELYPTSVLLQFAVKDISEGEHAAEVASNATVQSAIGASNALPHFLTLLGKHLRARLEHGASADAALHSLACAGEVQMLCAQMMLYSAPAASVPHARELHDAATSIVIHAEARHGASCNRLYLLAAGLPRHSTLMSCLLSIFSAGEISTADAITLAQQCKTGPPVAALRHPRLLALLVNALYNPSRPVKAGSREHLLQVLATVGAYFEATTTHSHVLTDLEREELFANLNTRKSKLLKALQDSQRHCERNEVAQVRATSALLRALLHEEVVSRGVLLWARVNLTHPELTGAFTNKMAMPPLLMLMVAVAQQHPPVRPSVLEALLECLMLTPPADSVALTIVELKRQVIDCMMILLAIGDVIPVLSALEGWLSSADLSLIRHALHRLLELAAPPFSEDFAQRIICILEHPHTYEAYRSGWTPALAEFLQHVRQRMPGIASRATKLLAGTESEK